MTLQGRFQENSLPHNSKVKSHFKFTELDINASQTCTVVLITGGAGEDSAELFVPSDGTSCSLPPLPEIRSYHTASGGLAGELKKKDSETRQKLDTMVEDITEWDPEFILKVKFILSI